MSLLDEVIARAVSAPVVKTNGNGASSTRSAPPAAVVQNPPTIGDIPARWVQALLGPGYPLIPFGGGGTQWGGLAELEPRSFQYVPNVNTTISPRIPYGLISFAQLKYYGENVPEVARARRLLTEELKNFVPQILGPDGNVVQKARVYVERDKRGRIVRDRDGFAKVVHTGENECELPGLGWLTTYPERPVKPVQTLSQRAYGEAELDVPAMDELTKQIIRDGDKIVTRKKQTKVSVREVAWEVARPDRRNAFPIWLTRFLYNTLIYDAPCFYRIRDKQRQVIGLRVIDGSTIFALIDERGEQPAPPAPAFTQIIYGQPRQWFNTYQFWYSPRQLRVDAPYGITPIEDSLYAVDYLDRLWQYERAFYTEGTLPEMFLFAPPTWTPEQVVEFEKEFNARMAGNASERRRLRFLPTGFTPGEIKEHAWPEESYKVATDIVSMNFGVHPSELGQLQGTGLSGAKGGQEKGEDTHARMGVGPLKQFVEAAFNDVLLEMDYEGYTFELGTIDTGLNPQDEEQKQLDRWTSGAITRDNFLEAIGMEPVGGAAGEAYLLPTGKSEQTYGPDGKPAPIEPAGPGSQVQGQPDAAIPEVGEVGAQEKPDENYPGPQPAQPEKFFANASLMHILDFEKAWGVADLAKHCGVCPDDDDYFGAPVSRETTVMFPQQGANESEIVAMSPRGMEPRPAIWKPEGGENDELVEAIGGPLYVREEAAYLLDRCLGVYLVPLAYIAEVEGERGAALHYVRGNEPRQNVTEYATVWIESAAVLDFVNGQTDRMAHNWLTHPQDETRPILIDNGLTYSVTPRPIHSAFVDAWAGQLLSASTLQALKQCQGDVVWRDIEAIVGAEAAHQAKERLRILIEQEKIPIPVQEAI